MPIHIKACIILLIEIPIKERIKLSKRFSSAVIAMVVLFVLATTSFAATTETFYGGYSNVATKGSIVVELTNISSKKNVILSETEAEVYLMILLRLLTW